MQIISIGAVIFEIPLLHNNLLIKSQGIITALPFKNIDEEQQNLESPFVWEQFTEMFDSMVSERSEFSAIKPLRLGVLNCCAHLENHIQYEFLKKRALSNISFNATLFSALFLLVTKPPFEVFSLFPSMLFFVCFCFWSYLISELNKLLVGYGQPAALASVALCSRCIMHFATAFWTISHS